MTHHTPRTTQYAVRNMPSETEILEARARALARPPAEEAAEGEVLH